jgi:hypothetical protein
MEKKFNGATTDVVKSGQKILQKSGQVLLGDKNNLFFTKNAFARILPL